jgi:hypothetical protein
MKIDQVAETRRTLKEMNDAADRAIDRHVGGPGGQVTETRRVLQEMKGSTAPADHDKVALPALKYPGEG